MEETEKHTFGQAVRGIIADKGIKQRELSDMTGFTPPTINNLLSDRSSPSISRALNVLDLLGYKLVAVPKSAKLQKGGYELADKADE